MGVLDAHGGESRQRTSAPVRMIYSFTEAVAVRLDFEPWARLKRNDGTTIEGATDPTVLLRLSRALPAGQTVSLETGAKLAVAKRGLGSGKPDAVVNGLYTKEFDPYYVEASFGYSRLGSRPANESRNEFAWYADLYRTLNADWTAIFELSGTDRTGTRPIRETLLGLAYRVAPQVAVVGRVAFGLSERAPDHSVGGYLVLTFR